MTVGGNNFAQDINDAPTIMVKSWLVIIPFENINYLRSSYYIHSFKHDADRFKQSLSKDCF